MPASDTFLNGGRVLVGDINGEPEYLIRKLDRILRLPNPGIDWEY